MEGCHGRETGRKSVKRFEGKLVLVTGGASGIGRATVLRLAKEGARVAIGDLDLAGAKRTAAEAGNGAVAFAFDAADSASCAALVKEAVAALGGLDVVVNNAGMLAWGRATEFPDDVFDKVLKVNLFSVFWISKHALPHLLERKGNIVNISSAAALAGVPYSPAYCASKAGVNGLVRSMAVEFAEEGVRVNAICPGGVDTPLNTKSPVPEWANMEKILPLFPKTKKSSSPDEIAAAVAYLASDEACNVTGIAFSLDGGQTAG